MLTISLDTYSTTRMASAHLLSRKGKVIINTAAHVQSSKDHHQLIENVMRLRDLGFRPTALRPATITYEQRISTRCAACCSTTLDIFLANNPRLQICLSLPHFAFLVL